MSRRRAQGAVRGPASALTSFLAGLGVETPTTLTTWGNTRTLNPNPNQDQHATDGTALTGESAEHLPHLAHDGPMMDPGETLDPAGAVTARNVVAGPTEAGDGIPTPEKAKGKGKATGTKRKASEAAYNSDSPDAPGPSKRNRAASVDSDDLDGPVGPSSPVLASVGIRKLNNGVIGAAAAGATKNLTALKAIGEFMDCGECGEKFTVTAYTKEHPTQASSWLCVECCYVLGIDPFAKAKKAAPKKKAAKKEDRGKVVSYEDRKGVVSLGDICIQLIGRYIEDVEQLGDIGGVNMDKVCKIISKSRRLTPEAAALFYSADRTELAMYDCTRLVHDSFLALARLCPNLTSLHLHLCGQLMTDSLIAFGKSLKSLTRIELFAPFLVRKEGWIDFFKQRNASLQGFLITQSPRIDLETIETMVDNCPNLTELQLAEIGMMQDDFLIPIGKLDKLQSLDLSSPGTPLSDDAVVTLLSKVGTNLVSLNLSDNSELGDMSLISIAKYCPSLKQLYLRNCVEFTDEGVTAFFDALKASNHPGLEVIDLEKGHELKAASLKALIAHSGPTIEKLSLLGWKEVEKQALGEIGTCKRLKELNIGWCRCLTDFEVKDILEGCDEIKVVKVWGCNQLTDAIPRKKGVKVIGVETHSI
ncbi:DNA repair protein RAD7, partial [Tremellales sp. Uapishka_1]